MACNSSTFLGCTPGELAAELAGKAAASAWDTVCKSFADAAVTLLKAFAKAFVAFPNVDLSSTGVRNVYGLCLGLSGVLAALLLLVQIARTAITHDGEGLAQGVIGIGKAVLAFMTTLTVAGTGLVAADQVTVVIIEKSFGSSQGLEDKLAAIFTWTSGTSGSLLLIIALIGMLLVTVLWFELLLRNAAVAVLIATSPIAAAGMVSQATKDWWSKLVSATLRLIILKPVIALVFAVAFGIMGGSQSEDIGTMLAGMLVLLLAVLAWPAIARFFTFAAAHTGGGTGLAAMLGFAAGQLSNPIGGGGGGGAPAGVDPDQFGQAAESRTMASFASRSAGQGANTGALSAAGGTPASATAGAGAGASGGAAAVPLVMARSLDLAQRAANSLVGRMEQTAGHAGLPGASPYAHPAGYSRGVVPRGGRDAASQGGTTAPERPGEVAMGSDQPTETPPAAPADTTGAESVAPAVDGGDVAPPETPAPTTTGSAAAAQNQELIEPRATGFTAPDQSTSAAGGESPTQERVVPPVTAEQTYSAGSESSVPTAQVDTAERVPPVEPTSTRPAVPSPRPPAPSPRPPVASPNPPATGSGQQPSSPVEREKGVES
jgi:hypothetical protein